MERLASIILDDLSLYGECHHCKRINLLTNSYCHTCMFPEIDSLTPARIQFINKMAYIEESIKIK